VKGKACTITGLSVNVLNSIRLEKANQWQTIQIPSRNYVTDASKHDKFVPSYTKSWDKIQRNNLEESVFKSQQELVKLAGSLTINNNKVLAKQILLAKSLKFRLLAVLNTLQNQGSSIPGIDNYLIETQDQFLLLVERLKEILILADKGIFKSTPVRQVMIPNANGVLIPLGFPTIEDRALQSLINLILEPLVELKSDLNSYGFRQNRGTKNAIAAIHTTLLAGQENK
jgi:RNA-directed DNA polymerase